MIIRLQRPCSTPFDRTIRKFDPENYFSARVHKELLKRTIHLLRSPRTATAGTGRRCRYTRCGFTERTREVTRNRSARGNPSTAPQKQKLEPNQELIRSVTTYIKNHISEPIRILDIARETGHSESSLRAKFRTASGIPLGTYIRRFRITYARSIMLTTNLTLQEVAEHCGYDSIYTFSRTFRNEIGISPSLYRKKV